MTVSLMLAGSRNAFPGNKFPFPLPHLPPKQKHISISVVRESESETLSVVNSAKNDPTQMGWAKLPSTGRFTRRKKKDFDTKVSLEVE